MKTNELQGAALDWAVAKCEGLKDFDIENLCFYDDEGISFEPSCVWSQGGPIIEREGISLEFRPMGSMFEWIAFCGEEFEGGETALIAAMRCYVASKLGVEIEVPDELDGEEV
jgi:hypothetical protein